MTPIDLDTLERVVRETTSSTPAMSLTILDLIARCRASESERDQLREAARECLEKMRRSHVSWRFEYDRLAQLVEVRPEAPSADQPEKAET